MKHIFTLLLILTCTYCASTTSAQQLEHNISAIGFLAPLPNSLVSRYTECPFEVQYQNNGTEDEDNVTLIGRVLAKRYDGKMRVDTINCDTIHISHWKAGEVKNISFGIHTMGYGLYLECYSLASLDQLHKDDTLKTHVGIGYNADIGALAVVSPHQDTILPVNTTFNLSGMFIWRGLSAVLRKNVPAQVKIRRWHDNYLVFQADTIIPSITYYDDTVTMGYPNRQGVFDVRNLGKGVFKVAVISKLSDDGDRTNDTAYSYITIANKITETDFLIDSLYSPLNNKHFDTNVVPIRIKLRNDGLSKGLNKTFIAKVTTSSGSVIYRDTIFIPLLGKRSTLDTQFTDLVISRKGPYYPEYKLEIAATPPNEEQLWRDTVRSVFSIGEPSKIKLLAIAYPANLDTVIAGTTISPKVVLRALWGNDFKKYKLKAKVGDDYIYYAPTYHSDTSMPTITTDDGAVTFSLPILKCDDYNLGNISKVGSGGHTLICYIMSDTNSSIVYDSLISVFNVKGYTLPNYITLDSIYPSNGDTIIHKSIYVGAVVRNSSPVDITNINIDFNFHDSTGYDWLHVKKTIPLLKSGQSIEVNRSSISASKVGRHTINIEVKCDTLPHWLYGEYYSVFPITIVQRLTSLSYDQGSNGLHLQRNHPNPFSATTTLSYEVASGGYVTMRILDVAGVNLGTVMSDEFVSEGKHEVPLDGSHLPSGTYFVEMVFKDASGVLAREIQPITVKR